MSRMTIDFGIDLGTTNSSISVMNSGQVETLDVDGSKTMPSCVYIDPKGNTHVGSNATKRLLAENTINDVRIEFKREMGHEKTFTFASSGKEYGPTDLSAMILSKLRSTSASRFSTDPPPAVVITIPALFDAPARNATADAGKLAGFEHVELIMEPVAAAVAASVNSKPDKAFWLVFDFGGGTFDASVVSFRDDQMSVVEHAGDNYLGGSNLDWEIVEKIIIPHLAENHDVSHLTAANVKDDNPEVKAQMFYLKQAVAEVIKKELSENEQSSIFEEDALKDSDGNGIDVDIVVTRNQFDSAIEKLVDRSIAITKDAIAGAKLKSSDIEKVILVGGTTFVPLVREKLSELNIDIDCSSNPMTMVSRGAAIYAATKRMPDSISKKSAPKEGLSLKLEYPTSSKSKQENCLGKVNSASGDDLDAGLDISINRVDASGGLVWETGSMSLNSDGMFETTLRLDQDSGLAANEFTVVAKDSTGATLEIHPSSFSILFIDEIAGAILPQSIRIGKADNSTERAAPKGAQLPFTGNKVTVHTTKVLKANSKEAILIPFVEGEQYEADRNLPGGRIVISGMDIENDIPINSAVELKCSVDESGVAKATCFVEITDQTFESDKFSTIFKPDAFRAHLERVQAQLTEIERKVGEAADDSASSKLEAIAAEDRVEEIGQQIDEGGEADDTARLGTARNDMIRLQNELDEVEAMVNWPATLAAYKETCEEIRRDVQKKGKSEEKQILKDLEEQADQAIQDKDGQVLEMVTGLLESLKFQMHWRDPDFLMGMLGYFAKNIHLFPNKSHAETLLAQGARAAEVHDVDTMASIVQQLWDIFPRDAAPEGKMPGGFDSDVI